MTLFIHFIQYWFSDFRLQSKRLFLLQTMMKSYIMTDIPISTVDIKITNTGTE